MTIDDISVMSIWLAIPLGLALSFVGSLPPGLISLTVTRENVRRGVKAGLLIALGASLVEGIQAFISIEFTQLFSTRPELGIYFRWLAVVVFFALGISFLLSTNTLREPKKTPPYQDIGIGIVVSSLNFLAYPYWIFYGTYLQAEGWLQTSTGACVLFSGGVAIGTFFALLVYIFLSKMMMNRLEIILETANKVLALMFFVLGSWQLWVILMNLPGVD